MSPRAPFSLFVRAHITLAAAAGLGALLACSHPWPRPPSGDVLFSVDGKVERGPYRFGSGDLYDLPRRSFEAVPPFATGAAHRFEGVDVSELLGGPVELSPDADTAIFHGEKGIAAPVPLGALRQQRPVLAERADGAPMKALRAASAPLQLVWPNLDQPGIDSDPRMVSWWVGAVSRVEVRSWVPTYGRALRVPPGSTDEARLGADVLSSSCIACHKVRGVGGSRGPELTESLLRGNVPAFVEVMRDHVRRTTSLSSAPSTTPAASRQVAAFLRAVAVAGNRADDEAPPSTTPAPPRPPPRRPPGM